MAIGIKLKVKKTFLIFNILLLLFFSAYVAPRAQAFAFAPFLIPAAGTVSFTAAAPVILTLAVIASGVYVGLHYDDIVKEVHSGFKNATSGIASYWNTLDSTTQADFNAAASSVALNASVNQTVEFTPNMQAAVRNYMAQGYVTYSTSDSTSGTLLDYPLPPSGLDIVQNTTVTQAFIDQYQALWFTAGDGSKWALVPMKANYDFGTGAVGIKYHWAQWTAATGVWKMQGITTFGFGTSNTTGINTGVGTGSMTGTYYNVNGELFSYKVTSYSSYNAVPALIAQYKWYLAKYYPTVMVGTATWVPNLDDFKDVKIPTVGTLNIPAGSITTTGTSVNVAATDAMTTTLADSISTPATPPVSDPWTPSGKLNFAPLVLAGNLFTTKFPFSIPWDVKKQFDVFNVTPKAPVLHVDKSVPAFGTSMKLKFDIDFSMFDTVAVISRWFLVIAFDIALILAIRKFMPE